MLRRSSRIDRDSAYRHRNHLSAAAKETPPQAASSATGSQSARWFSLIA